MADFAATQPLYIGLDGRERGPADELPALASGALVTASALCDNDDEAVAHLLQVCNPNLLKNPSAQSWT